MTFSSTFSLFDRIYCRLFQTTYYIMETKEIVKTEPKSIDRKDFMKQVGIGFGAIMLMNCLQACSESEIPDPMINPGGDGNKVDFTLNLNDTGNSALNQNGGFLVVSSRGVIVARKLDGSFIAVSSACTHQGTTINYRRDTDDFLCPNHQSVFSAVGAVTRGPATAALKRFNTSFTATSNTVRVFE